jgi:hypothetical protein
MEQKSMSAYEFKKGDLITRIEPSKPLETFDEEFRDRSYIGVPLKFLGIANGCVYVEKYESKADEDISELGKMFRAMLGGSSGPINLPLDIWSEGWSYYIDPYNIGGFTTSNKFNESLNKYELNELKKLLKKALEEEDYLRAENIQKRIDKIEK